MAEESVEVIPRDSKVAVSRLMLPRLPLRNCLGTDLVDFNHAESHYSGGPKRSREDYVYKGISSQRSGLCAVCESDLIAAGLSPFAPETADVAAGRAMLRRLDELVSQREDFALETTLSGNWLYHRIREWQDLGYTVELYFIQLDTPEIALLRIAHQVKNGGHDVAESTVRRRFARGITTLEKFKEAVNRWAIYNNSGEEPVLEATMNANEN